MTRILLKSTSFVATLVFIFSIFSITPSNAEQVSVRGIKSSYVLGDPIAWTVSATRGDICIQSSEDSSFSTVQLSFLGRTSAIYKIPTFKVAPPTIGEKKFSIECTNSGRVEFSFTIKAPAQPIPVTVLGLKDSTFTRQGLLLLITASPKDRCGIAGTDSLEKGLPLDSKGAIEYRYTSPVLPGTYRYKISCRNSGFSEFTITVLSQPTGVGVTQPPFMTGSLCGTEGDITELRSGDKGICLTKTKGLATTKRWYTITEKPLTPCFVEGMKIERFSTGRHFLCVSNYGSLSFRKYD
jgi:hypothetical protein